MKQFYIFLFLSSVLISKANTPSIIFKENRGQWPDKVLFGSEFLNTKFYVNKNSFNYCVYNPTDLVKVHENIHSPENYDLVHQIIHGHNYEACFVGGDLSKVLKQSQQPEYYNYFLGNNKSKWAGEVKAFGDLVFSNVYAGIDLNLYSTNLNLKYDLIIKPNADPLKIKISYNNTFGVELVNNELVVKTSVGNVVEKAPLAYQLIKGVRVEIECKYILVAENTIGFAFPAGYDKNYELVIDPTVVVCSYSGSTVWSNNSGCTFDTNGNIFDLAYAEMGYPTSTGAFQINSSGYYDFLISKYDHTGSSKIFSTYVGGDSIDFPLDITVKNNEIVLFGMTLSKTFPYTTGAFDSTLNGTYYDLVVSKLNISGTSLLASTYIGGSANEGFINYGVSGIEFFRFGEMACDSSGNVYLISATTSTNFPTTPGAISSTLKGGIDACVFKFNKSLSTLVWSTLLGGSSAENGKSIRLDGSGGVYCYGTTNSTNFPTTPGCYRPTKSGAGSFSDLFISHLNATGTSLIASTYLGTNSNDYASLMDLDQSDNVYLCGNMDAPSLFTSSPGLYSNTNGYNFIYKMNASLSGLIYKTKFGNFVTSLNPNLAITAFKADSCQNIYISGWGSNSFQTTPNALQSYTGGKTNMYIALFNTNCTSFSFASYFGGGLTASVSTVGDHSDGGLSHFDGRGYLYQDICNIGGLPVTANAYALTTANTTTNSFIYNDAFLKLDFKTFVNANSSYGANITGCPPFTANFVSTTNTGTTYWNLGDGTTSTQDTISHIYQSLGNYNVLLVVTDTNTCNKTDSVKSKLSVILPTSFTFDSPKITCINQNTELNSPVSAINYTWSTGANTSSITVNQPGTYSLTIDNGGCKTTGTVNVVIGEKDLSLVFPNIVTPNNDGVNDFIDFNKYYFGGVNFVLYDRWGKERVTINDASAKWSPGNLDDGTYFYVISYFSDCTGENKKNKGFITVLK